MQSDLQNTAPTNDDFHSKRQRMVPTAWASRPSPVTLLPSHVVGGAVARARPPCSQAIFHLLPV